MTDAFAEFGLERRPWWDAATIQSRYHELAALRHPDKCGGDPLPLARLNEARKILVSHSLRLRHLLDSSPGVLECKFQPDFDLFSLVGNLARKAGAVSTKRDSATSELTAAIARAEVVSLEKEIDLASERIRCLMDGLEEKIRDLNVSWPDISSQQIALLAEEAAFYQKWGQSLRDAKTLLLGG